jgi:hypothetical protein
MMMMMDEKTRIIDGEKESRSQASAEGMEGEAGE